MSFQNSGFFDTPLELFGKVKISALLENFLSVLRRFLETVAGFLAILHDALNISKSKEKTAMKVCFNRKKLEYLSFLQKT